MRYQGWHVLNTFTDEDGKKLEVQVGDTDGTITIDIDTVDDGLSVALTEAQCGELIDGLVNAIAKSHQVKNP